MTDRRRSAVQPASVPTSTVDDISTLRSLRPQSVEPEARITPSLFGAHADGVRATRAHDPVRRARRARSLAETPGRAANCRTAERRLAGEQRLEAQVHDEMWYAQPSFRPWCRYRAIDSSVSGARARIGAIRPSAAVVLRVWLLAWRARLRDRAPLA